jgi:hypothetical protein
MSIKNIYVTHGGEATFRATAEVQSVIITKDATAFLPAALGNPF